MLGFLRGLQRHSETGLPESTGSRGPASTGAPVQPLQMSALRHRLTDSHPGSSGHEPLHRSMHEPVARTRIVLHSVESNVR